MAATAGVESGLLRRHVLAGKVLPAYPPGQPLCVVRRGRDKGGGGSGGADMSPRWGTHDDSFDHACTVSVETTGRFGLLARFPCLSLPSKASLCEPPKLLAPFGLLKLAEKHCSG